MAVQGYRIRGTDGRDSDPFDSDALLTYCRQGYIQPQTLVFDPTVGSWLPAAQLPALAALGQSPQPPPMQRYPGSVPYAPYGSTASPPRRGMPPAAIVAIVLLCLLPIIVIAVGAAKFISQKTPNQTITSTDGLYSVSVPGSWLVHDTSKEGVTLCERRLPYETGITFTRVTEEPAGSDELDRVTTVLKDSEIHDLKSSGVVGRVSSTTVNGFPAQQFEMNDDGGDGGVYRFRHTVLSTPSGIYSLVDFTEADQIDHDRPGLDTIVASFRGTSQARPSAPQ